MAEIEKAGELGEYYNPATKEKGFKFEAERVHCTGRITQGKYPLAIDYNSSAHTVTETWLNDKNEQFTEVYTFTVSNGEVTALTYPNGETTDLSGFTDIIN